LKPAHCDCFSENYTENHPQQFNRNSHTHSQQHTRALHVYTHTHTHSEYHADIARYASPIEIKVSPSGERKRALSERPRE